MFIPKLGTNIASLGMIIARLGTNIASFGKRISYIFCGEVKYLQML